MKQPHQVTLDDVQSDSIHLAHLLDVVMEHIQNDFCFVENGERNAPLDRLSALIWIARDMAERTESNLSAVMKNRAAAGRKEAARV